MKNTNSYEVRTSIYPGSANIYANQQKKLADWQGNPVNRDLIKGYETRLFAKGNKENTITKRIHILLTI